MDDLVTWLRAQLDEDERIANAVNADADPLSDCWFDCIGGGHADHHMRWDQERVLPEVDAKRRILDHLATRRLDPAEPDGGWEAADTETDGMASHLVRLLALPYADRPGYRDEWRPTAS